MSSPRNFTRPLSGAKTPLIRLNTVDLPAPFGPIKPRISPSFTVNVSSPTACSPPKRLPRSRTSSSALTRERSSFEHPLEARPAAVEEPHQPAGRELHYQEQQ